MRRKETKERVFEKFGILKDDNGKKLAQAIIKIDNFIKSGFEDFYL